MRYDFYRPDWPSFDDVQRRIQSDNTLPPAEQKAFCDDTSWLLREASGIDRFRAINAGSLPFAKSIISGLLREVGGKHEPSKIRLVRAGHEALLTHYQLTSRIPFVDLLPDWERDLGRIGEGYRGRHLKRPLLFFSAHGVGRGDVKASDIEALHGALIADPALEHPETEWNNSRRAWEWAMSNVDEWPKVVIHTTEAPCVIGQPWTAYRPGSRGEVEGALRPRPGFVTWDPNVDASYAPDPDGFAHGVDLIRICIAALDRSGVRTDELSSVRDFLVPENFEKIAEQLFRKAGCEVTRLVMTKLARLQALANRCGLLLDDELGRIGRIMDDYRKDHAAYCSSHPSRVEEAARGLDVQEEIRRLRNLPLETFEALLKSPVTRKMAAKMKQAAMLALLLDGRLSTVVIRRLVWEKHLSEMDGEFAGCLRLYVAGSETANGVARDAIICREYSQILRDFVAIYRPVLDLSGCSQYLFPGACAKPLSVITISRQQIAFLREHSDVRLTPEVIKELLKQMILQEAPEATGLISAGFGLCNQEYVSKLAEPYQNDLESRQFGRLVISGALMKADKSPDSIQGGDL